MYQWEQLWRFLCEARTESDLLRGWRDVIGPKLLPDIVLSVVVVEKAVGNPLTRTTTDRTSTGIEVWGEEVYFWGGPHRRHHYRRQSGLPLNATLAILQATALPQKTVQNLSLIHNELDQIPKCA